MQETEAETRDYTGVTTKQVIVEMLKENTGGHLLDSGGAYGRNWERNQSRDFAKEPACSAYWSTWRSTPESHTGSISCQATVSLYHWMMKNLEFDPDMQAELDAFAMNETMEGESWLTVQEAFAEALDERDGHDERPFTANTYNDSDNVDLSQVIQYVAVYTDGAYEPTHLIVSVHGGCDVRGGYTAPKCFKVSEDYTYSMQVDTVCAGQDYWTYESCLSYLRDASVSPTSDVANILSLPAYDLDWLDDESDLPAEVKDIRSTLAKCDEQIEALAGTILDKGAQAAHELSMRARKEGLQEELLASVSEYLAGRFGPTLLVHDGKAWLVEEGKDPEPLSVPGL